MRRRAELANSPPLAFLKKGDSALASKRASTGATTYPPLANIGSQTSDVAGFHANLYLKSAVLQVMLTQTVLSNNCHPVDMIRISINHATDGLDLGGA